MFAQMKRLLLENASDVTIWNATLQVSYRKENMFLKDLKS